MNNKDLYFPYVGADGKKRAGTASLLHHINEVGGIQAYNDEIGEEYIKSFVKSHSDTINAIIASKAKRRNFKIV